MKTKEELLLEKQGVERRILDLKNALDSAQIKYHEDGIRSDSGWFYRTTKKLREANFLLNRICTDLALLRKERQDDAEKTYQSRYLLLLKRIAAYRDSLHPEDQIDLDEALKADV